MKFGFFLMFAVSIIGSIYLIANMGLGKKPEENLDDKDRQQKD